MTISTDTSRSAVDQHRLDTLLAFANIETAIVLHMETHAVRIDPDTRYLLTRLRDLAESKKQRLKNDLVSRDRSLGV